MPPPTAPAAHEAVTVTVVYAIYDGLPLYEKHVVVSAGRAAAKVVVTRLTTDTLYVTNEAMDYWGHAEYGSITSASNSGRVHMESEMSRGGATTTLGSDSRCTTCTQGASSRQRDGHFADTPLSIPIETRAEGGGGCSRMTVSPTARRVRRLGAPVELPTRAGRSDRPRRVWSSARLPFCCTPLSLQ